MKSVSCIVDAGCEFCGHVDVKATFKRDPGSGAELLIECPACGHEEWSEISEEAARRIPELLGVETH